MLTVLVEGDGYVAMAKPVGRIVVPGRGAAATEVTLRQEFEAQLGRPLLVVHRLDRDTSGALLFATDAAAHRRLSRAFEHHQVVKHYWAVVRGRLMGSGDIALPLFPMRGGLVRAGRDDEKVGDRAGKPSHTHWRALERIGDHTLVDFRPTTGRLHQIRAHAAALGHPLAVDPDYGGLQRLVLPAVAGGPAEEQVVFDRTPLHALTIKFSDPRTGTAVTVEAPLPEDLTRGVDLLRRWAARGGNSPGNPHGNS